MVFTNKFIYLLSLILFFALAFPVNAGSNGSVNKSAGSKDDVTVEDIQRETNDVIQTLQAYTLDQQQEAVQTARQAMQQADQRINRLETRIDNRWDQLSKPARKEARAALRELRQERVQLSEWYGSMKESSQDAWSEMRTGFSKAYKSMSDAWQDAQEEFDRSQKDA